jgi:GTP cyclohydrolase FolE2
MESKVFEPRAQPRFATTFGVPAEDVLRAMDEAGDDIPYQRPEIGIGLPRVGLVREHVPLRLRDPFASGREVSLDACVRLLTEVPADKRGIHTSRIGSLLAEGVQVVHASLQEYVRWLAEELRTKEYGGGAEVRASGTLSYLERVEGWKGDKDKVSLEHVGLSAAATLQGGQWSESAGFVVQHITACPCVQQTYKHALQQARSDIDAALGQIAPLLTHSQRCTTRIEVRNLSGLLPFQSLFAAVDGCVFRVQNTLPREFELHLVYRAHRNPQFLEDATRQIASAVAGALGEEFAGSTLALHSTSMESIHDFDIVSELETPVAELWKVLR